MLPSFKVQPRVFLAHNSGLWVYLASQNDEGGLGEMAVSKSLFDKVQVTSSSWTTVVADSSLISN